MTTLDYNATTLDIAVLDQLGIDYTDHGSELSITEEGLQKLRDIANYGIDGGFSGFIYYSETTEFARNNLEEIKSSLSSLCSELGEDVFESMRSWGCLRSYELTAWEIAEAIYNDGEWADQVLNALAWYAAEETARAIADAEEIESEEEEEEEEEA